ncbi:hypothetical protein [Pantoea stewartii]|uniref:hypothetical protein n=1 Tax=Pantoea stewartii TaxID=66269 RepID=UPI00345B5B62
MVLFHGTRKRFDNFDVSFKGTGESGTVDACWFTHNFDGAKNHALFKNRNEGKPIVYRCEVTPEALIADPRISLNEQPHIAEKLYRHLPVAFSCELEKGFHWHPPAGAVYRKKKDTNFTKGKTYLASKDTLEGKMGMGGNDLICLYKACGIHGVYYWEGVWTDPFYRGPTTIIFDFACLKITDIIEV